MVSFSIDLSIPTNNNLTICVLKTSPSQVYHPSGFFSSRRGMKEMSTFHPKVFKRKPSAKHCKQNLCNLMGIIHNMCNAAILVSDNLFYYSIFPPHSCLRFLLLDSKEFWKVSGNIDKLTHARELSGNFEVAQK